MDLAATLINTFVVLAVGAVLTYVTNDRFRALRHEIVGLRSETKAEIVGLRTELKAEIATLRSEMKADIGSLRTEDLGGLKSELKADIARLGERLDAGVAAVRSDLIRVALAVGARRSEAQG